MHEVQVIFGEEATSKFTDGVPLDTNDLEHVKIYSFNSTLEMHAFVNGMEEAIGWRTCDYILNKHEFIK